MSWLRSTLGSTVGRKALVGLTGLGLVGFLIVHVLGNLNMYKGDEGASLDAYAEGLHHLAVFPVLEIGLLGLFLLHIFFTLQLVLENRRARVAPYAVRGTKRRRGMAELLASRTMAVSGLVLLAFLLVHVWDFRLQHGSEEMARAGGLFGLVSAKLNVPWRAGLYVAGALTVGFHMFHGIQSAARSLGVHHARYTPLIERFGFALAWALALTFASFPIWFLTR